MSIRGWVYVITNKAMPQLVKVGYSTKDPALRAKELDGTGIPHAFEVVYDALVLNPREVEQKAHKVLGDVREGKEWFRCSIAAAVQAIQQSAVVIHQENAHYIGSKSDIERVSQKCAKYGCTTPPTKDYKGDPLCEFHWRQGRNERFGKLRPKRKEWRADE